MSDTKPYWSALPWEARGSCIVGTDPSDGDCIAIAEIDGRAGLLGEYVSPNKRDWPRIAEHIVKCVNGYDALVACHLTAANKRVAELEGVCRDLSQLLCNLAQILDTLQSQDWATCWSDWDQQQRNAITDAQRRIDAAMNSLPQSKEPKL
jgi:hypothetical protein